MQVVAAILLALFSYAAWWYVRRSWREFRRTGRLHVTGRGLTVDFRHTWAVCCYLGFDVLMGLTSLGAAVALLVAALR